MKNTLLISISSSLLIVSGCMNMPTPPSQITSSYTNYVKYDDYTKKELTSELNSLKRRETQLIVAQEQRYKTSKVQAFWWGYGQGDGIEASELAIVRGEIEAILKKMENDGIMQ
ncbi:MAG: hypothetical protein V5783_08205 [Pontiella sp.]